MLRLNKGSHVHPAASQVSEPSGPVGTLRLTADLPTKHPPSVSTGYPQQTRSLSNSADFLWRLHGSGTVPAPSQQPSVQNKEISKSGSTTPASHRPAPATDFKKQPFDISLVNGDLSPEEALEKAIANSMKELSTEQRVDFWDTSDEDQALALALQLSQEQLAHEQATRQPNTNLADDVRSPRDTKLLASGATRCTGPGLDQASTLRAYEVMKAGAREVDAMMASEATAGAPQRVPAHTSGLTATPGHDPQYAQASMHLQGVEGEVLRLNEISGGIADWMNARNITIKPNGGGKGGHNCLLISILQHVSGNYSSEHREQVDYYRQKLDQMHPENAGKMLYNSGDGCCDDLIEMVNRDYPERKLSVAFYYGHDSGKPYLIDRIGTGENPVPIWHTGAHYAALVHEE